jgi:phosphomannomutase
MVEEGCQLLLANDGDADRFGLIDSDGKYLGANHALPLIADYLINYKQGKGALVRTVSTSHLLDDLAAEQGLDVIETAVGFKYVGDELRKGALIGGEESGGISVKGHIPEKDGILTCLLLLELAATSGEGLQVLLEQLQERIGRRAFIRVDQELEDSEKLALMGALKSYDKDKFAGKKIAKRNEIDGVKFLLEDNSWVLVRPSGTEPLVRIYIEVTQPEALGKFKAQVLDQVKALIRS